ncbi:MAG: CPBP family intramembrane glutamic endopeptidase [Mycobacteriaceae bacterium]
MTARTNLRPFAPTRRRGAPGGFWTAIVVFGLGTILGSIALRALQPVLGISPALLVLPQLGPSVGVLGVVLVCKPVAGVTGGGSWWPDVRVLRRVGCGAAVLAAVLALSVVVLAGTGRAVGPPGLGQLGVSLWFFVPLQLLGVCGEELGWRVFLQQHLQTRWPMTAAALAVGTVWAGWHVEYYRFGPLFFGAFWLACVALSVILAHLVHRTGRGALLIAGAFHCLLNLGTLVVLDFSGGELPHMLVLAGTTGGAAVVLAPVGRVRRER